MAWLHSLSAILLFLLASCGTQPTPSAPDADTPRPHESAPTASAIDILSPLSVKAQDPTKPVEPYIVTIEGGHPPFSVSVTDGEASIQQNSEREFQISGLVNDLAEQVHLQVRDSVGQNTLVKIFVKRPPILASDRTEVGREQTFRLQVLQGAPPFSLLESQGPTKGFRWLSDRVLIVEAAGAGRISLTIQDTLGERASFSIEVTNILKLQLGRSRLSDWPGHTSRAFRLPENQLLYAGESRIDQAQEYTLDSEREFLGPTFVGLFAHDGKLLWKKEEIRSQYYASAFNGKQIFVLEGVRVDKGRFTNPRYEFHDYLRIINLDGTQVSYAKLSKPGFNVSNKVAIDQQGNLLIIGSKKEPESGPCLITIDGAGKTLSEVCAKKGTKISTYDILFHPNQGLFCVGMIDKQMSVWNLDPKTMDVRWKADFPVVEQSYPLRLFHTDDRVVAVAKTEGVFPGFEGRATEPGGNLSSGDLVVMAVSSFTGERLWLKQVGEDGEDRLRSAIAHNGRIYLSLQARGDRGGANSSLALISFSSDGEFRRDLERTGSDAMRLFETRRFVQSTSPAPIPDVLIEGAHSEELFGLVMHRHMFAGFFTSELEPDVFVYPITSATDRGDK